MQEISLHDSWEDVRALTAELQHGHNAGESTPRGGLEGGLNAASKVQVTPH